ncbi:hypothetical protein P280DRAFT_303474 [Massarina eburnea CBS 473.64]|uniref:Uncharacterized protein n=1 Tax=Massarina eburnea CBS 473.64 TaxID=1395130 RepID=A0A6A6S1W9_9PLEO|nr:hypothetical protein P280DRAFT_303474 [Massarina eburnea CBS 473.64]
MPTSCVSYWQATVVLVCQVLCSQEFSRACALSYSQSFKGKRGEQIIWTWWYLSCHIISGGMTVSLVERESVSFETIKEHATPPYPPITTTTPASVTYPVTIRQPAFLVINHSSSPFTTLNAGDPQADNAPDHPLPHGQTRSSGFPWQTSQRS